MSRRRQMSLLQPLAVGGCAGRQGKTSPSVLISEVYECLPRGESAVKVRPSRWVPLWFLEAWASLHLPHCARADSRAIRIGRARISPPHDSDVQRYLRLSSCFPFH